MKLITKDTDYAARALCCIAKHKDEVVSARELVRCLKIPRPFLRKIMQVLSRKGIVRSYKGKGGGFSLLIEPYRLSLLDIIIAFQGPIKLNDHTFRKKVCPHIKNCRVKKRLDRIERIMISELKAITIKEILD